MNLILSRKQFFHTGIILFLVNFLVQAHAQNPPVIGDPAPDTFLVNSGRNFLFIPGVDDGENGSDQEISFTVTSSDTSVVMVDDVTYGAGQTFAILHITERGKEGSAVMRIKAEDPDGSDSTTVEVWVGPYQNRGINFEIHDIVFWQQMVPLKANPAFSMVASGGEAPYGEIDLPSLKLSVYSDCQSSPPCTGVDFFTALFKGYLTAPVTGTYYFYMIAGDQCSIGLSTDENPDNSRVILFSPENGRVGTSVASKEWKSVQVSLEAGKTYAIYGVHWNIHTLIGGMQWEGPGIERAYIPGEFLSTVYDVVRPSVPQDLTLVYTGIDDFRLRWSGSTDNKDVLGYHVYVNGVRVNDTPVPQTFYRVTGLAPGTEYCALVTSMDRAGNESAESSILCTATYASDAVPPDPPASLLADVVSDISLRVSWSGATDGETEIRGYRLYVDGVLYNGGEMIYGTETVIAGLVPETTYIIEVEALDAGYNVSARSAPLAVTTTEFDPYDTGISDKKARVRVILETIGRSEGLGVNVDYVNGDFLGDPEQVKLIRELKPAALRWGALTANPLSFEDFIGTGKDMTFGKFMDFCNQAGAYSVITCGVEDATDWRTEPQTFTRFLEYLAGPADSEYGAIRASEGYTEPLLHQSRGLVFEFGNEVWGGSSHSAQIGSDYLLYGAWCREMATLMKGSEYYDPDKIFLVYSGRNPHPNDYSKDLHQKVITGDTGQVDWLAVSGYMGGNLGYSPEIDPGKSELDYYKNGITGMGRNLEGLRQTMDIVLQASGDLKPTYMYEANMTDATYFGRLGQALVQTDYYASVVETGSAIPTIFHLTGGQWKMVVPGQDYHKLPLFHTARFYNWFCKGNALRTQVETSGFITDGSGVKSGMDPVGSHAYARNGAFSVLLISRDFENEYTVQVDIPDELTLTAPETGMKYIISGNHFSDREAVVDSVMITMSDSLLVRVPAYSMVLLTFGGDGGTIEQVPLGFYDYVSATSVEIYAYNTEIFDIDRNGGKKILLVEVEPDNVLSDAVKWSVTTGGVNVEYGLKTYGFDVQGSGTCDGNGTITIRASAWDNPAVYDEVVINISNQGTGCDTGTDDPLSDQLRVFPNPAVDRLFLEGLPGWTERVTLADVSGRICLSGALNGPAGELDLGRLEGGVYYLSISGTGGTIMRMIIKE